MPIKALSDAPQAERRPFSTEHHAILRHDDYAWLRDDNWQQVMTDPSVLDGDIRAHLEAENAYCAKTLAPTQDLQDTLFAEMRGRIAENDASVPVNEGALAWAVRYISGGEHPIICYGARDAAADDMQTAIDANAEAEGQPFFKLGGYEADRQGRMLAWSFDDKGSEYFSIKFRDLPEGDDTGETLRGTTGALAWSACGGYLFYGLYDDNHRPNRVMRHKIGTDQSEDTCLYEEADAGFFVGLSTGRSGRFLVISAHDHETGECWLLPTDRPEAMPVCVAPRRTGIEYSVDDDAARDRLVIVSNFNPDTPDEKAEDFQILTTPCPTDTGNMADWQELVPHRAGCLVLDALPFAAHLAVLLRENALPRIEIIAMHDGQMQPIIFDEAAYDLNFGDMAEYDTNNLRFTYASMTTPAQIFDYDMTTGGRLLRKTQNVPSGHDPQNYVTERFMATGHDGAQIPVSVLYHKDTPLDGTAPVLQYGYGAYGITIPAGFSTTRLSLVDRGFIYAIGHIRGGKARGHNWFMQGRRENKPNSFLDFVSVARALIDKGWTKAGNITIHGGSAGGLLVGATVNLAPDLFRAAVAEVPFVDVLTTMLDDTLPLTPPEWPEWGNPIASEADYRLIESYAPYENIAETGYPHLLATAGLTDPRVTYWEPAKWVARLREKRKDDGLTLLHTEMSAGHGGKAGRFNQLHEIAMVYAFVLLAHDKVE